MTLLMGKNLCRIGKVIRKHAPLITNTNLYYSNISSDFSAFITPEKNPGNHTKNDLGLIYTVSNDITLKRLFRDIIPNEQLEEYKTFQETPFLIRKPALEIINYLKNANYDNPVNKYVLYGKNGIGKTSTLFQVILYAHASNWLIFHVPSITNWTYARKKEKSESLTNKGYLDLPTVGAEFLERFRSQNENLIKTLNLQILNTYKWNIKEQNEKGESLIELVNHGIARSKYSCDVINALIEEVKGLSCSGKVKTLVAIGEFNKIFEPLSKVKNFNFEYVNPEKLSCVTNIKNLARSNWRNGAVIVTCKPSPDSNNYDDYFPMKLLGAKGFEFLEPFVPIEIPPLSEKEIKSFLAYYRSKKWLLRSDGDHELRYLCHGNPLKLRELCSSL